MKTKKTLQFILLTVLFLISSTTFAHWTTKGPYGGKVKCMTVCDTLVYVGTYDGGVYRSTNSFLTAWRYANYTGMSNPAINALTSIGKKVIAGTPTGIFRSADMGNVWLAMNSGLTNTNVLSAINSGSLLFAGTDGGGVFMSQDSAVTWVPVNTGLTNMTVTAFAVNGSTLYAGTSGGGVFISTNNGTSWSAANMGLANMNITTLLVSGTNIFAGTGTGVFVSNIVSVNWNSANTGLGNSIINCFAASGSTVFAATNGGVYSSPNLAPTWSAANTGYSDTVKAVIIYNTKMIAGTKNAGLYKSNSIASVSWVKLNTGFNNLETYDIYNSGLLVIAATNKGMFVSRDLAATYVSANTGLTDSLHVNSFTFNATKLYAATKNGGVFMSADTGRTWTAINNNIGTMNIIKIIANNTHLIAAGANSVVYSTLLSVNNWSVTTGIGGSQTVTSFATDGATTFLGTNGGGVYITTNNSSWTTFTTGLTNMAVTSLVIKGVNVYAGTNGGGIFKSPVSAAAWATVNAGLPTMNIQSLCTASQWVVAGYKGGVHATYDDGNNWSPTNVLLYIPEFSDVKSISFTSASTRIFVGLPNNSLYSNGIAELPTGISEMEKTANNILVGPNPNNGNFAIALKDVTGQINEVVIYDISGRLVEKINGENRSSFNVSANCNTGLYFVRVKTDKGISIHKILIE